MPTQTDWTAPHWEAVAAEQPLIDCTLEKRRGAVFVIRSPHGGRKRIKHPETGRPVIQTGDVAAFGPSRVLRLLFAGEWHVIPSHSDLMGWTFDGVAETPDGRDVEPDDRDSWLFLLGLV